MEWGIFGGELVEGIGNGVRELGGSGMWDVG